MAKKVTDEAILNALEQYGSTTTAAKVLGVSRQTLYNRRRDRAFRAAEETQTADRYRKILSLLQPMEQMAITTTSEIMANEEINPAIRLQAAQTLYKMATKYEELLQGANHRAATEAGAFDIKMDFDLDTMFNGYSIPEEEE